MIPRGHGRLGRRGPVGDAGLDDDHTSRAVLSARCSWMISQWRMPDDATYRIADELITADVIGRLYRVSPEDVQLFRLPHLRVVKASFPRQVSQGSLTDRDVHAGQQHVPLANLPLNA